MKKHTHILLTILTVFFTQLSFAQETGNISGTVTDEDGLPLPGVNIIVKDTQIGTQSNFDGNYTISAESNDILIFSYLGFQTVERTVGNATTIDLTLETDAAQLEEVVILGYTQRGQNQVTGSAVQVSGEEIAQVPVVSPTQALQGKVAGVQITQSSGTPGSVQDIRIRGVGSITAGNDPLYVIDGVPVVNDNVTGASWVSSLSPLSSLNSDDIESITVLKDASATSAYGARGSNGVIVVTTKSGGSDKTRFTFSATVGFQNDAVEGRQILNGAQRQELFEDGVFNSFGEEYGFNRGEAFDWAVLNLPESAQYVNWDGTSTDWADLMNNEDALMQDYTISASGGNEVSSFYASLGYNETEATVIGSDFKRISGKFNYSRDFSDKVRFTLNTTASNTEQNAILEQGGYFQNPYITKYYLSPLEEAYNPDGSLNTNLNSNIYNNLFTVQHDVNENNLTRAIVNSSLEWDIIDNLSIKTLIGLDYNLAAWRNYDNRIHGSYGYPDINGRATASVNRNFNIVNQNSLSYELVEDDHNLSVTALMEYQKNNNNFIYVSGQNFPADGLTYVANAPSNQSASASFGNWKNVSYLGLLNYSFARRYILDLTYRREGSSRFAPQQRFGSFWSLGAAWNLHDEAFMENVNFIDQLRIRGSYGVSGNSGIGLNQYQALLSYSSDYAGQGAVSPSQFGNNSLTWEKNNNYDVGVEVRLFERITGSFAYFHRKTYDLLQNVPLSYTTGHSSQDRNVGSMINKGIEVELGVDIFKTRNFNWNVSANVGTVENEVTELALNPNGDPITVDSGLRRTELGHPVFEWYMKKYAGVDPATGSPIWYINGVSGEVTSNYTDAGLAFQGKSALPTFSGGLSTHLDFKGFFLNATVNFAGGNAIYEDFAGTYMNSGLTVTSSRNGVADLMDRWQQPGDVTDIPKMVHSQLGENSASSSTRFLYDGDFIRLRNVSVGYNFPSSAVENLGFDGFRLAVTGTNLATWVKDDDLKWDPEVRADGTTRMTTPPVKAVTLNLTLNF